MKSYILINDAAGAVARLGAQTCIDAIADALRVDRRDVDVIRASGDPEPLVDCAKAQRDHKNAQLVLAGGDGTACAVVSAIAGSEIPLAILPGGTMNLFSRDLGFSDNLEAAIKQLSSTMQKPVDVATINNRHFLNNVVFGSYSSIAEARELFRQRDAAIDKTDAAIQIVGALADGERCTYEIMAGEIQTTVETNTLMISNNIYDGAAFFSPTRKYLNAGVLGLYLAESEDGVGFLRSLLDVITGRAEHSGVLSVERCAQVQINTIQQRLKVSIDGEVTELTAPFQIKIHRRELIAIAPQQADKGNP